MGYNTEFSGNFKIEGTMSKEFVKYINRFSNTRRIKRDNKKIKEIYPNWKELCFNGELGQEGEYLAIQSNNFGQNRDDSILDYNNSPKTQPGLWCQWVVETNEDLKDETINEFTGKLKWDGGEKFYDYAEWLSYLIENFFEPSDLLLNGAVLAVGEEYDDAIYIVVAQNKLYTYDAMKNKVIDLILTLYKENTDVVEIFNQVKTEPKEIIDHYWS